MHTPGYESLALVLERAYNQAAHGKGAERHAGSRPFTDQPMQTISELLGSDTGLLYQAMKKIQESQRLDPDAAIRELLGAINYIAGAIIFKESEAASSRKAFDRVVNPATGLTTHWLCYHGDVESVPGTLVPVGHACPKCFATAS